LNYICDIKRPGSPLIWWTIGKERRKPPQIGISKYLDPCRQHQCGGREVGGIEPNQLRRKSDRWWKQPGSMLLANARKALQDPSSRPPGWYDQQQGVQLRRCPDPVRQQKPANRLNLRPVVSQKMSGHRHQKILRITNQWVLWLGRILQTLRVKIGVREPFVRKCRMSNIETCTHRQV